MVRGETNGVSTLCCTNDSSWPAKTNLSYHLLPFGGRQRYHSRLLAPRTTAWPELLLRENGIITLCQVQVPFEEAFHSTDGMIVSSEGDFHCGINLFNHLL